MGPQRLRVLSSYPLHVGYLGADSAYTQPDELTVLSVVNEPTRLRDAESTRSPMQRGTEYKYLP